MPKATIEFTLPDEDAEFRWAIDGAKARSVLDEIDSYCRNVMKHDSLSAEEMRRFEAIRCLVREM